MTTTNQPDSYTIGEAARAWNDIAVLKELSINQQDELGQVDRVSNIAKRMILAVEQRHLRPLKSDNLLEVERRTNTFQILPDERELADITAHSRDDLLSMTFANSELRRLAERWKEKPRFLFEGPTRSTSRHDALSHLLMVTYNALRAEEKRTQYQDVLSHIKKYDHDMIIASIDVNRKVVNWDQDGDTKTTPFNLIRKRLTRLRNNELIS